MKLFYLIIIILLISCQSNTQEEEMIEETISKSDTTMENVLSKIHPNNLSEDLSWIVSLDIQEGFLLSYTITHQSGEENTYEIDKTIPIIGGVDHPEPHFINDTTYYIPNAGGSENGHFEIYIYQNGFADYKEVKN